MGMAAPDVVVVASPGPLGSPPSGGLLGLVPGGTETVPPAGHQDFGAGHFGPPPALADGAITSFPGLDSSFPLKLETAKA